jgi:glycosyltransferase involved in cell wall biosynthesis
MMDHRLDFPGKVALQQRVLPSYRVAFFDHLSSTCQGGLSVFAGLPRKDEGIQISHKLERACYVPAKNVHVLRGRYYLCYQAGWKNWLRELDPDILILEANPRYISNRNALRWMHHRGRPVVGWGLGVSRVDGFFPGSRDKNRKEYLKKFEALIAYSSAGAEQYAELGIPSERIHIALNSATFPPEQMPERNPRDEGRLRVLFVGRLQTRKRVDSLLQACALIEPKPECWIVGDGPERVLLERMAEEVFPSAQFFGSRHGQQLDDLFTEADLFVLPGTGGLAIQEAMAHALPVIAAEGDGTQRDLVTEDNGWLIQPGSLDELTQTLREALSNPERLVSLGLASYQRVVERANIDAMARVFINVMNNVTEGKL